MTRPPDDRDAPATDGGTTDTSPVDAAGSRRFVGSYELLEKIGEGAFGEVFRARQIRPIQRTIALKLLRAGRDSKEIVARFHAERQALALMDHPSIVAVLDAGETPDGRPFFAMELIRGAPITVYCDRERLDIEERLALFGQLCHAVQHAHHKGVIHRDLKPSNILIATVDGAPRVKIIDFGIAKALGTALAGLQSLTVRGQIVGTPAYMSPEQARGEGQGVDTRTDVYSLGVLLYELVSGALPYGEEEIRRAGLDGWLRMLLEVDPPRPSARLRATDESTHSRTSEAAARRRETPRTLMRRLHGDLDWIVMRCLEKDAGRRYPTASELAADVRRFLADEPVLAGPPTAGYRLRKLIRRRRGPLLAAGAVVLTAIAGIVVATVLTTRMVAQTRQIESTRVRELLQEARQLSRLDREAAREPLEAARALAPHDRDVARELALLPAILGRPEESQEALRAFLASHPGDGEALSLLAGLTAEEHPAEAEALRQRARESIDEAKLCFAEALATPSHERAVELFTRSLELQDWNFDAVWQRGVRLFQLERYPAALEDAALLARLAPRSVLALTLRGAILAKMGMLENAALDLEQAARISSPGWVVLFNRCWVRNELDELEGAVEDARRLAGMEGLDGEAHSLVGWVFLKNGDLDAAESALTRAIDSGYADDRTFANRGDARRLAGRFEQAVADYDEVVRRDPRAVEARLARAEAQRQLGHPDLAISDYREALALEPTRALIHALLGRALQREGKPAEALPLIERAVALEPAERNWWAVLGANHWMNGREPEARAALERALGRADTVWVRVWLWDLLSRAGDRAGAARVLAAATAELDTPLVREAVAALSAETLPRETPECVKTPDDRLYWHFTLATAAFVRGDRARAREEYAAVGALGNVGEIEADLARWRLAQL